MVLLVNGHRLSREGLKEMISEDRSIKLVGEAQNKEEAIVLAQQRTVVLGFEAVPYHRPASEHRLSSPLLSYLPVTRFGGI